MHSAIEELKTRADLVLAQAKKGDADVLARLNQLPPLRALSVRERSQAVKRKHALWLVAREFGFQTWNQAKAVLSGEEGDHDFGTLLYPKQCFAYLNHWYANHGEASKCRELQGGFLLVYKRQYLVVEAQYIRSLGLDPDDPDWNLMGRDWAQPKDLMARGRMYARLVRCCKPELEKV